jgi:GT2 family glycosyltransferase
MSRPEVSVVMPFAGDRDAARDAIAALRELDTREGDELILSDNSGNVEPVPGIEVVRADGEASPAHARNLGAEHAHRDWILFLDADCRPVPGLLAAFFAEPAAPEVGALAGEVIASADHPSLAARYGAARNFLNQETHLQHPYRPRAVAANLLVRREAFEALGGFVEGVRAAEDTDFSWRLQEAGWLLEPRAGARVEHSYRATIRELRRQWRGYAAGRAWLSRRYPGFTPEPALARVLRRRPRRGGVGAGAGGPASSRRDRFLFLALDVVLGFDELVGLRMSNRATGR